MSDLPENIDLQWIGRFLLGMQEGLRVIGDDVTELKPTCAKSAAGSRSSTPIMPACRSASSVSATSSTAALVSSTHSSATQGAMSIRRLADLQLDQLIRNRKFTPSPTPWE